MSVRHDGHFAGQEIAVAHDLQLIAPAVDHVESIDCVGVIECVDPLAFLILLGKFGPVGRQEAVNCRRVGQIADAPLIDYTVTVSILGQSDSIFLESVVSPAPFLPKDIRIFQACCFNQVFVVHGDHHGTIEGVISHTKTVQLAAELQLFNGITVGCRQRLEVLRRQNVADGIQHTLGHQWEVPAAVLEAEDIIC